MGDFQQVLQVVPPTPVINYPTQPRVIVVPPLPPVITYSTLTAPVVPTVAVERLTSVSIPAVPTSGSAPLSINALTPLSTFGLINPLITMENKDQPYYIPYYYLDQLQKQDPLTVSTLNAQTVNVSTLNAVSSFVGTSYAVSSFAQNISTNYIEAFEAYVYDKLTLDNQVLTANSTDLLLNGIPIATTSNLSSIADWAYDPAVSTIQANGNDLTNVRFANFSSIVADGLTVVKLTTLFSTTIEIFESTITSETQKLTVSSITGGNGFFDVLTANSFINPSASTINCQFINVSSNANIQTATFSNGANFNGTRPNFNTGINTSGANNFNFTNIDNASNINGNVITITPQNNLNITTSNGVATVVDRGADVGGSAVIGLTARFGAGSQINLNANSASIYSPTPASAINLDAQGNVSYISGIPFGGAVNISARAGLSGTGTSVAGGGGINLTAYSYGALAPGTIKESAGSILSYSGLTVPSVGVLGSGFYSALNCLSLTAGATPATTSFPGVVYLRGDNGTKVVNGFFSDTITATGNSVLPTITTTGISAPVGSNLAFFATSQNIQFNSATVGFNAHVAGTFSVSTITDVATINGVAYPPPAGSGVWVSTATTALNMAGFDINTAGGNINLNNGNLNNVSLLAGNTSGFLNINAANGMVIDINQGAELRLNTNADIGLKTLSTAQISIYQPGSSDFTLFNNGDARMNTKRNATVFAGGNMDIITPSTSQLSIYQQGGSDFTLFNNGDTRMRAVRTAFVEAVGDAFLISGGGNVDIRAPSTQNATMQLIGAGNQSYFQLRPAGSAIVNARDYVELIANAGAGGIYCTGAFTELRGYLTFNAVNNYINNLEAIYGDASAPGGGLAINNTYGLFFNSSGKNANLYVDSGNLNMINYNSGINIANYNAYGTGNVSLFSQNNDMYLTTGTGRDINLNGGRYVSINAAQPGGSFGIYASTINATSLQDINITANQNIDINGTTGVALRLGGASISIAGDSNIYLSANGTSKYANIQDTNVAFNTGTPGSLLMNMNGNRIIRVGDLNRLLGTADVRTPVIQYGIVATSGNSGSIVVNIPNTYTSTASYIALVSMEDTSPAQMSVAKINASRIEIYWANAGAGAHSIAWSCQGE